MASQEFPVVTGEVLAPPIAAENPWQNAVVYQIYPRSFHEAVDNPALARGEGNLRGITEKIRSGYVREIADAIWVSPFFRSPRKDGGYDVADHKAIDPTFGTLEDFDELIAEAHANNLKVIGDLIPNHTSDEHSWFEESRQSRDNPKNDWYIWRDPAPDGGPPNNYASVFSLPQLEAYRRGELKLADGEHIPPLSAWEYDERRGQYYHHSFGSFQPDLNWDNPDVREAVKDVMRFWIDRGLDGFRVDAVNHIAKNYPDLPDEAPNPDYQDKHHNPYDSLIRHNSANYPPTLYPWLKEMTDVIEEEQYASRNLRIIFEAYMDKEDLAQIDAVAPEVASTFNFTRLDAEWEPRTQQALLDEYYSPAIVTERQPNQVNGNHDKPRLASRLGAWEARVAAMINLTLPGMIYVYNGEELNLTNVDVPPEKADDLLGGRDSTRTPMPWNNDDSRAGFSPADSNDFWLPMTPNYESVSVETQQRQSWSTLSLYRALVRLRRTDPALKHGAYHPLEPKHESVLAFARRYENHQITTVANFSNEPVRTLVGRAGRNVGRAILSSIFVDTSRQVDFSREVFLLANEGVVVKSKL